MDINERESIHSDDLSVRMQETGRSDGRWATPNVSYLFTVMASISYGFPEFPSSIYPEQSIDA